MDVLLCQTCNQAIGNLGTDDGITLLKKAIEYVKFHEARSGGVPGS